MPLGMGLEEAERGLWRPLNPEMRARSVVERADVRHYVLYGLLVGQHIRHASHHHGVGIGRVPAAYSRLELLEGADEIPVADVTLRGGVHGLVPLAVLPVARRELLATNNASPLTVLAWTSAVDDST